MGKLIINISIYDISKHDTYKNINRTSLEYLLMDTKYQNLPKEYTCDNCKSNISAPMHCGHPMHVGDHWIAKTEREDQWICWMGPVCGVKDYEACCDNPQLQ